MGASESTTRSNATKEDERNGTSSSDESSIGAATAVATAAAGVAVAAWGISRMLSNNTENQEKEQQHGMHQMLANASNLIASGASMQRSMWSPPPYGRFKLNTDGACRPKYVGNKCGPSGYGGILRDHRGKWVQGFIGFVGESDCLTAEIHGIHKGLELLDKLNLERAILETDSQAAYQLVTNQGDQSKSAIVRASWPMITNCRRLAEMNGITIKLIPGKDANRCADKLADMAIAREEVYVEFEYLPDGLRSLVEKDAEIYG